MFLIFKQICEFNIFKRYVRIIFGYFSEYSIILGNILVLIFRELNLVKLIFNICNLTKTNYWEEADQINNLLSVFERALDQKINVKKSSVFSDRNINQELRQVLCNLLRFNETDENTKYLGLPNILGINKSAMMGYLKNRLRDRIQGWDKKLLSMGGKEIHLKTLAQTLPNYAMSIFLLPNQLCTEMDKLMSKFWWKLSSNREKGFSWKSWDRLCKKKSQDGLGFRKLHNFNVVLLGKQGWRLITNQDALVSKIYKARYYMLL